MTQLDKKLVEKLNRISILLTDVDGVLTDGGLYYSKEGMILKRFNVKDGMGTVILRDNGYKTGLISSDSSPIMSLRGDKLQMDHIMISVLDKKAALFQLCDEFGYKPEEIAFIGDDKNDIEILKEVGFSAAANDAIDEVKKIVHYICSEKGGRGCYREVADMIYKYGKYAGA